MTTEPEGRLQESSEAVKMARLDGAGQDPAVDASTSPSDPSPSRTPAASQPHHQLPSTSAASAPPPADPDRDNDARKDSMSIEPTALVKSSSSVCQITLLLPTSARHPYKIDEKYLSKRNVTTPELTQDGKMDPFSISVYTLKELILREWRPEWDTAPASPGSIRLIFFGKLLDDKLPLSEYNFSPDNSNIVHMTIRPPETDEDETTKGGKTSGSSNEGGACGCCVVS